MDYVASPIASRWAGVACSVEPMIVPAWEPEPKARSTQQTAVHDPATEKEYDAASLRLRHL